MKGKFLKLLSDEPEIQYSSLTPYSKRKRLGQFFTPVPIAQFMGEWILSDKAIRNILDPALGLGIFFRAIISKAPKSDYNFVGYEIDNKILNKTKKIFQDFPNVKIFFKKKNYLSNDWKDNYDGIICNPPYLKFHDYKNKKDILSSFESKLNLKLTGFTNIYTLFFLKSVNQLASGGRAAYIVPSEFLNANYGRKVKEYLLESGKLRFVIIVDFRTNVFNNATTTSSILLFANDRNDEQIEFITVKSINELRELEDYIKSYPSGTGRKRVIRVSELDPEKKWRKYYGITNGHKYKNLVPLSSLGKVVRGIATGGNNYFCFSQSKIRKYSIPIKYFLPVLAKTIHAPTNFFTKNNFNKLREKGKSVFLLNALDLNNKNLLDYLKKGEEEGVDKKYLTSHRSPWYSVENRPPASILVTVFNRKMPRFVRNEANISNLTCFHCVYIKAKYIEKSDILMAYLLTDIAQQVISDEKREYGGGLNKFEPNDLNKAKVIDLEVIDKGSERKILDYYRRYRQKEIMNQDKTEIGRKLNEIFYNLLKK